MALILAIESDRRQVNHLTAIVRGKLHAELVLGETAEGALERLGDRVPDLILTSALLSPRDEQALGERLRRLNGVAAHVQTLTLPVFGSSSTSAPNGRGGVLSALLGDRGQGAGTDGCDPSVFAEQCREYLRRAAADRKARHDEEPEAIEIAAEPTSIMAAVAALEQTAPAEPAHAAPTPAVAPIHEEQDEVSVDIDLSDLLADSADESEIAESADADSEPPIYELSAEGLEIVEPTMDTHAAEVAATAPRAAAAPIAEPSAPQTPLAAAPQDDTPPAVPETAEEEFDDWQQVVDALKRESARVRVPRDRTNPAAPPRVETAPAKPPADATRTRRQAKALQDEWGMFDPAQAGMAALYERLEEITKEEDEPASA